MGLMDGIKVLDAAQASVMGRSDALQVYEWGSQAKRVLPLEERLVAQDALISGLKDGQAAQDQRFVLTTQLQTTTMQELGVSREQAANLQKQIVLTKKKSKWEKVLWGVGALGVGYLGGRATR
jgi:hypothetical protein